MNKTELKSLRDKIDRAIQADEKTDAHLHGLAVSCLRLAADHGDFTMFARLIGDCKTAGGEVFERGVRSRRLALLEWVKEFSPIRINGDGVMGLLKPTAKGYVAFDVNRADANPFWTLQAEADRRKQDRPFDLSTISGRISGISKAIDKAVEKGTVTPEDETVMRELAQSLNATMARFLRERNIDLAKLKEQKAALQAETPVTVEDEQPPANDTPELGGKVVNG
jgi:hypothetical protein